MLKLLTVVMTVACCVTGVTSDDNDVPVDKLLTMFARLMTNEISAIKGEIKNVKTGQGDLLQNVERLVNDTLVAMTNEMNVLKTKQDELSATVNVVNASLASIQDVINRMSRLQVVEMNTLLEKQDNLSACLTKLCQNLTAIETGVKPTTVSIKPTTVSIRTCSYGYYRSSYNGCYKFYTTWHTWDEAKARCTADGAHLVTIDSKQESDALIQLMKEKTLYSSAWYWIGGEHVNGRWIWTGTNEEMTFTNWGSGYPGSVSSSKTCAHALLQKSQSTLYWRNNYQCSRGSGYVICEI